MTSNSSQQAEAEESKLLGDIRAMLSEHHADLITHIESCISAALAHEHVETSHSVSRAHSEIFHPAPRRREDGSHHVGATRIRQSERMTMDERDARDKEMAHQRHHQELLAHKSQLEMMAADSDKTTRTSIATIHVKRLVEMRQFEVVFAILIFLNSVLIGVEVQLNTSDPQTSESTFFVVTQCSFAVLFSAELILRITAEESPLYFFLHSKTLMWNYTDTFIIVCMMIELGITLTVIWSEEENRTGAGAGARRGVSNVRLLRILRVTRLIRTLRMIRLIRFVRDLRLLVNSIFHTLYALGWSMLLLAMIIYVFAILFTQEAADYLQDLEGTAIEGPMDPVRLYFGTLGESMFTLFKSISGGVSWHEPVSALDQINYMCVFMFTVFVGFVYFAVLNVVTGVFCTSAIESSLVDRENAVHTQIQNKKMWQKKMEALFETFDADGSSAINVKELEQGLRDPHVKEYMASLELDPEDAWTLFKLLDTDSTYCIDIHEFVLGCFRLRGPAKSLDVAKLIYDTKIMAKRQETFMQYVEAQLSKLASYSLFTAEQLQGSNAALPNMEFSKQKSPPQVSLPPAYAQKELGMTQRMSRCVTGAQIFREDFPNGLDVSDSEEEKSPPSDEWLNGVQLQQGPGVSMRENSQSSTDQIPPSVNQPRVFRKNPGKPGDADGWSPSA